MAFNISYVIQAVDQFTGVAEKINAATKNLEGGMNGLINKTALMNERMEELQKTSQGLSMELFGAAATLFAVSLPIKKAIEFEEAMANVRKVVDFDTPEQFKEMGLDIQNLAKSIPMSQQGLAEIVAAAGQFGIKRKDLMAFTETAAKMGVAFDITADEAGRSMAVMSNIFNLTIPQVGELGDAINYLSNSVAATAPGMIKVIMRVGTIAKGFGLAKEETAALAASMLQLGIEPERASTALISLLNTLQLIGVGSKEQKAAFKALGLNAKTFGALMKKDAAGALMKVSEAYGKMDPKKAAIINKMLFGEGLEGSNIRALLSNSDKMKNVFAMVADKGKLAGSMQREFAVRSETTSNQLKLLFNRLNNLSINIGSVLLPALNSVFVVLGFFIDIAADLAAQFPFLTKVIFGAVIGLLAFRVISIACALLMVQLRIAVLGFQIAMATLPRVLLAARSAMLLFSLAMAAHPIGFVISAISLLAIGVGVVMAKFQTFGDFVKYLKDQTTALIETLKEFFNFDFKAKFDSLKQMLTVDFSGIADRVGGFFSMQQTAMPAPAALIPTSSLNNVTTTESKSTVDINIKGNPGVIESVKSKTDGNTNLAVSQNMALGGY